MRGVVLVSVEIKHKQDFVVGTVKGLSDKYGIRYLLEAAAIVKEQGSFPIKLRIAGKGPQEEEYKKLARDLKIDDITTWLGFISQEKAAEEWANMDVAVIPSTLESESFGVSAVEAQACGTPVIISDIPGLMEATDPGITSVVVPRGNAKAIAEAIERCSKMSGYNCHGREYTSMNYSMNKTFISIENMFYAVVSNQVL